MAGAGLKVVALVWPQPPLGTMRSGGTPPPPFDPARPLAGSARLLPPTRQGPCLFSGTGFISAAGRRGPFPVRHAARVWGEPRVSGSAVAGSCVAGLCVVGSAVVAVAEWAVAGPCLDPGVGPRVPPPSARRLSRRSADRPPGRRPAGRTPPAARRRAAGRRTAGRRATSRRLSAAPPLDHRSAAARRAVPAGPPHATGRRPIERRSADLPSAGSVYRTPPTDRVPRATGRRPIERRQTECRAPPTDRASFSGPPERCAAGRPPECRAVYRRPPAVRAPPTDRASFCGPPERRATGGCAPSTGSCPQPQRIRRVVHNPRIGPRTKRSQRQG
ncbi:hypothetical protein SAMN04488561_4304 [Jiangella alba]|uniref:Uncharacterized protein n=1 Tax=Jiangella alba TaxID=561176 RepID=A0A1H5PII0_9ACTN|nr:hypothetical protein SAMN04488561_4304 [Jiangella alba]